MVFVLPQENELLKGLNVKKCAIIGEKIDSTSIVYKNESKD
jgi:hypothetical protein